MAFSAQVTRQDTGDVVWVDFTVATNFETFKQRIRSLLSLSDPLDLCYIDDEAELISLCCDEELAEGIRCTGGRPLCVVVRDYGNEKRLGGKLEQSVKALQSQHQPASTIQILGAEKALFRALKEQQNRNNNPTKYGLIYHASIASADSVKDTPEEEAASFAPQEGAGEPPVVQPDDQPLAERVGSALTDKFMDSVLLEAQADILESGDTLRAARRLLSGDRVAASAHSIVADYQQAVNQAEGASSLPHELVALNCLRDLLKHKVETVSGARADRLTSRLEQVEKQIQAFTATHQDDKTTLPSPTG